MFFETVFHCVVLGDLELHVSPDWPQTHRFTCLCFLSADIKDVCFYYLFFFLCFSLQVF